MYVLSRMGNMKGCRFQNSSFIPACTNLGPKLARERCECKILPAGLLGEPPLPDETPISWSICVRARVLDAMYSPRVSRGTLSNTRW